MKVLSDLRLDRESCGGANRAFSFEVTIRRLALRKYTLFIGLGLLSLGVFSLAGCTQNQRARAFGGTETIEIAEGQKVVNISWKEKDNSLWILTRPMREGEAPEIWSYKAKSNLGILEGEVILKESK